MTRPIDKPRWATSGTITEPSEGKKDVGWIFLEKPPFEYFNWFQNNTYNWLNYIDTELNQFSAFASDPPDMGINVTEGRLSLAGILTEVPEQSIPPITAPTTNDRIDRILIEKSTGGISLLSGAESATPTEPSIPAGFISLAKVYLTPTTTEITNADITDERPASFINGLSEEFDATITGGWIFSNGLSVGSSKPQLFSITNSTVLAEGVYFDTVLKFVNAADQGSLIDLLDGKIIFTVTNETSVSANDVVNTPLDALIIENDATTKLLNGNVLISPDGASITPAHPLMVYRDASNQSVMQFTNATTGTGIGDGSIVGITSNEDLELWNFENTDIIFATNNTFRAKITNTGNVFIGDTEQNPVTEFPLTLYKSGSVTNYIHFNIGTFDIADGALIGLSATGELVLLTRSNKDLIFYTDNAKRGYFASDGGLVIGTPTGLSIGAGSINAQSIFVNSGAVAVKTGDNTFTATNHFQQGTSHGNSVDITATDNAITGLTSFASSTVAFFHAMSSSFTGDVLEIKSGTASGTGWDLILGNAQTNPVFRVRGDGQIYSDAGTSISSPADYAEMFEWIDGNPNSEDRVGISVVLENGKIREAKSTDDKISIIGVVSGNPACVADSGHSHWQGKYLSDEFNRPIYNDDNTRKLNENYNNEIEYIPRENRNEWDSIGILGKLAVKNNQQINPNWVELEKISEDITRYLVR